MKSIFAALLFTSFSFVGSAQSFHFDIFDVTLEQSSISQTPAHWYIEIFNDVGVDTTLHWKTNFSNIQAGWVITFDDQNAFVNPLNDGDESDFTLYGNPTFPQKLIIGNILNNTAGIGSAYFDVWDPADTSTTETIGFHFIITEGTANLDTEVQTTWYSQANNVLSFRDDLQGAEFELYDTSGKLLRKQTIDGEITLDIHEQVNHFMMRVHSEGVVLKSRVSSYTK